MPVRKVIKKLSLCFGFFFESLAWEGGGVFGNVLGDANSRRLLLPHGFGRTPLTFERVHVFNFTMYLLEMMRTEVTLNKSFDSPSLAMLEDSIRTEVNSLFLGGIPHFRILVLCQKKKG